MEEEVDKRTVVENDAEEAVAVVQMMLVAAVNRQVEENGSSKQEVHEGIARQMQARGARVSAATVRRLCTAPVEELVGVQFATVVEVAAMVGLRVRVEIGETGEG